MRWLLIGILLLSATSLVLFGYSTVTASQMLAWQTILLAGIWLAISAAAWHFLYRLPQGVIDFDGENWYFSDQLGTVSVRLDVQNGMLLRFESEFKRISWLWLEASFEPNGWYDLRRAVYSRPARQNLPDLI